jgi:hypothetical protein
MKKWTFINCLVMLLVFVGFSPLLTDWINNKSRQDDLEKEKIESEKQRPQRIKEFEEYVKSHYYFRKDVFEEVKKMQNVLPPTDGEIRKLCTDRLNGTSQALYAITIQVDPKRFPKINNYPLKIRNSAYQHRFSGYKFSKFKGVRIPLEEYVNVLISAFPITESCTTIVQNTKLPGFKPGVLYLYKYKDYDEWHYDFDEFEQP